MDTHNSNIAVSAVAPSSTNAVAGKTDNAKPAASETRQPAKTSPQATKDNAPQRDSRSLQYRVVGDRVITTIIDENDKTVVIQIPDAEVIRIAKAIDRMQGFLLEQKA